MNWLYLANARIPSEKAHVYQILQMADALEQVGERVRVVYPARANLPGMRNQDPRDYYGLRGYPQLDVVPSLDLVKLVTIDVPRLNRRPLPLLAHALQETSFAMSAAVLAGRTQRSAPSRADLLYSRDWPVLAAAAMVAPRLPAFWEAHDLPQRPLARRALRRLLSRLAGVVAISDGLRQELASFGARPDRVLVAPDAVDLRRFERLPGREEARRALAVATGQGRGRDTQHPGGQRAVVYTGHLYRWKGAHTLALASRHLPDGTVVCVVGGTPSDLESFRRFVAEEGLDRVRVVGHVPPSDIPSWLAAADVVALPNSAAEAISARYTSPLKLFEYMAAERPIVASDLPSLREVLTHDRNALLVPPDDPQALAAGLRAVLDDAALGARLAVQARRDVQERTWEARARQVVDFARRVIAR